MASAKTKRKKRRKTDPGGRPRKRAGTVLTELLYIRLSPSLNRALSDRMRAENRKLPRGDKMTRSETAREILREVLLPPPPGRSA